MLKIRTVESLPNVLVGRGMGEASAYLWCPASDPSKNNNFTYVPESGGFADVNRMCIDQRGFSYLVQAEAAEFLKSNQLLLNQTVDLIEYSQDGVAVRMTSGHILTADHALVTFSVGVLQNTDVVFKPQLPNWKREAINNIEMVSSGYR